MGRDVSAPGAEALRLAKARKGGANPGSWRCCGPAPSGRADGIVDRGFLGTMGPGEEEVTPTENVEEPDA